MQILVYGAGVIGSLCAVLLSKAGFNTTVYARGQRLREVKTKGLLYKESGGVKCK